MPTDATGTPTSLGIRKYNTSADAPSGLGFNGAMDDIDALLLARVTKPAGIALGEVPVWNGSTFVRNSSALNVMLPGTELVHTAAVADVPFSATTFAGATTLLTSGSFTYDGSTPVMVEVFSPHISTISSNTVFFTLWDGATDLGILGKLGSSTGGVIESPLYARGKITLSNAAHTLSVRGVLNSAGTGTFGAGPGGSGGIFLSAFIRVTKV